MVWVFSCVFCRPISIPAYDISNVAILLDVSNHPVNDVLVCILCFVRCQAIRFCFLRVFVGFLILCGLPPRLRMV